MLRSTVKSLMSNFRRVSEVGVRSMTLQFRRFDIGERPLSLSEMDKEMMRITGAQHQFDPNLYERERKQLLTVLPLTQDELPPRTQRDSYAEVLLPLSSDLALREKFINVFMGIRTGRLLECLDGFAVFCCFKYVLNPKQNIPSPFCIVTALVDELTVRSGVYADPTKDILMTGFVSWVGTSSMEVTMSLVQEERERVRTVFLMVARDPLNRGSAVINPMMLEDDLDRCYFENGARNTERRKQENSKALAKTPPDKEESLLIHDMFLEWEKNPALKPGEKLMSDATYSDICVCHPTHRNRYNKIFGGYVMRLAYELAWASATSYCGSRVGVAVIDDIWFRVPVEVGSILHFRSTIGYTEKNSALVRVVAEVEEYRTGAKTTTNVFYFTFKTLDGGEVPKVIPRSYQEYIIYLDSRRHMRHE